MQDCAIEFKYFLPVTAPYYIRITNETTYYAALEDARARTRESWRGLPLGIAVPRAAVAWIPPSLVDQQVSRIPSDHQASVVSQPQQTTHWSSDPGHPSEGPEWRPGPAPFGQMGDP